jgi:Mn-dependent DtxR family transcriptional regulator
MVITPASAAYQLTNRLGAMLVLAGAFGAVSALVGMSLAFVTNSPSGPSMVIVATVIFAAAMWLSPSNGLLARFLRRRGVRRHREGEDALKALYHLSSADTPPMVATIARRTGLRPRRIGSILRALRGEGLVESAGEPLSLTERGRARARELVRAHRLWESYLAGEAGIGGDAIHDEAERLEHAHELADEVDALLGFPARDPHGEEIPSAGEPKPSSP